MPVDIVSRILRRKRHWFHGSPTVTLIGEDNSFGELQFDFGDEVIKYKIYIKDRKKILDVAVMSTGYENFLEVAKSLWC